jgi:phospholipid/cholesterol/gamma-HCH transport system substrate-binding protein
VKTAIRKHLGDFLAILFLFVMAVGIGGFILSKQRLRFPLIQKPFYEVKAVLPNSQAVTPGQGQTVRVAGVEVGQIGKIKLQDGRAVVNLEIEPKYKSLIKRDASALLRAKTGVKDMFIEVDPGESKQVMPKDGQIPVSNTEQDIDPDEILSALDGDTQAYLRLLLIGGGQGLKGQGQNLGKVLASLGPLNRDLDRLNSMVAERRHQLADLVHNLGVLTKTIGEHRGDVTSFVRANNAALSAIGAQDPNVQRAVSLLPSTLSTATNTFQKVNGFAHELGPAFNALRPFARHLDALNTSVRQVATEDTPIIQHQIRPFVRAARPDLPPLDKAAQRYSKAAPKLTTLGSEINRLANMAAYNPHGAQGCPNGQCDPQPAGKPARDEGYLYWLAWLGHNGDTVFQNQDANGVYRRIYFTASCSEVQNILDSSPLAPLVTPFGAVFQTACKGSA